MGPAAERPPFPEYEWLNLPPGQCQVFKVQEDCNYAQAVEGTIDTAHAGVLHRTVRWHDDSSLPHEKFLQASVEVEYTKYGMRYAGLRKLPNGSTYARMTITPMPYYTLIPPDNSSEIRKTRRMANAFVPRDDQSTWHMQWFFDQTKPVDREFRIREGGIQLQGDYRKQVNIENWYGQDRKKMKDINFSGIDGVLIQDHAVVETQGRITDRTQEHLGTTDVAVVAWRRQLIRAAKALAATGERPAMLSENDIPWQEIKAAELILPPGGNWKEALPLDKRCAG
jgi:hypothetical protein